MVFNIPNLVVNIGEKASNFDWVNPLSVFITGIITSIISILIANWNNKLQQEQFKMQIKEQQKQFIKAPYIQREAEILIKFRELVYKSKNAFFWFMDLLRPYKIMIKMFPTQDVKLKGEDLVVKFVDYCKNYNVLNELNTFYNNNQMILKKNNIDEEFIYITAILNTISWLKDSQDFHYDLICENDNFIKYKLNVIDKLGELFVTSIDFEKNPNNFESQFNEEKLQEYSNNIMSVYLNLQQKLDEITTFYDGDLPKNLKIKSYPNSIDYIRNRKEHGG
jgi:hypothetical protein